MDLFPQGDGPPRDVVANLIYRVLVLAEMARNPDFAANVEEICRRDALFFHNTFGWIYEPRPRRGDDGKELPKEIPFVSWSHQDPVVRILEESLGYEDVGGEKARGEGASWIACLEATRWWSVKDRTKINFVSKDEDAADRKNDSDSLMWKVDFAVERLPRFFVGEPKIDYIRNYSDHVLYNVRRGSAITAYAATANVASGGRADWFLMDELSKFPRPADADAMASTQYVTDSRLIVGTPLGTNGAYYEVMHEDNNMRRFVLDWRDNPSRNRGLYLWKHGRPEAVDPVNNPLPPEYDPPAPVVLDRIERLRRRGFKIEGKVRSPWYDLQCDRPKATPESIARELDRDYGGSELRVLTHRFFDAAEATVRPPDRIGEFRIADAEKCVGRFEPGDTGPLSLWMNLDEALSPPKASYMLAADIAQGGAEFGSNSVISGINIYTREQVLEYVTTFLEPGELAAIAVALARWLGGAFVAWEANGPGGPFGRAVMHTHGYLNVYEEIRQDTKTRKKVNKAGWWTTNDKKWLLFAELSGAVQREELIIRSAPMIKEAGQYIIKEGKVTHTTVGNDPSHGDRAIALGICNLARLARPAPKADEGKQANAPPGSIAYRQNLDRALQDQRDEQSYWSDRTIASMQRGGSLAERNFAEAVGAY